jgi:hypothetical protein
MSQQSFILNRFLINIKQYYDCYLTWKFKIVKIALAHPNCYLNLVRVINLKTLQLYILNRLPNAKLFLIKKQFFNLSYH